MLIGLFVSNEIENVDCNSTFDWLINAIAEWLKDIYQ